MKYYFIKIGSYNCIFSNTLISRNDPFSEMDFQVPWWVPREQKEITIIFM